MRKIRDMNDKLEPMDEFFTARLDMYDSHMLGEIEELPEAYAEIARLLPAHTKMLLDLGCGTGLELEQIFKTHPDLCVTGIDLTQAMLDRLREKFTDKVVTLICTSYLGYNFGDEKYDAVVSVETMHHLADEKKRDLYANIYKALKCGGKYIECDYMVDTQDEEDRYFEENRRSRAAQGISDDDLFHYDTPLTVENQIKLFLQAGFSRVEKVFRKNGTAIIVCEKRVA
jgi:cyclopropane fatty-acyl-phospholipid synthase-like methyltransferase